MKYKFYTDEEVIRKVNPNYEDNPHAIYPNQMNTLGRRMAILHLKKIAASMPNSSNINI